MTWDSPQILSPALTVIFFKFGDYLKLRQGHTHTHTVIMNINVNLHLRSLLLYEYPISEYLRMLVYTLLSTRSVSGYPIKGDVNGFGGL